MVRDVVERLNRHGSRSKDRNAHDRAVLGVKAVEAGWRRAHNADHRIRRGAQDPLLAREVGAVGEMWLIVSGPAIEDVEALARPAKLRHCQNIALASGLIPRSRRLGLNPDDLRCRGEPLVSGERPLSRREHLLA